MRKFIVLGLLLLAYVVVANTTELFRQVTTVNSGAYTGQKWFPITTDTAKVNTFVVTAVGPVHAVVGYRVRAFGKTSAFIRLDSIATTNGTVVIKGGITNDSLMRTWFPGEGIRADTLNNPARTYIKKTPNTFEYRIEATAKSSGNGGALIVSGA